MASKVKLMVILGALVVFGAIFVPSAFAECGPGFSSKSQLIQVVKENPSIAHGMRKELLAEPKSEYSADETVLNYLRESSQKVEKAPSGYKLKTNTYCPGGYGDYQPYGGLLENMPGKVMLWHVNKNGEAIPLLKGYCMNFVTGKAVQKKSPPKHKVRKPKKCGCKHKKHHKPPKKKPVTCVAKGLINGPNGSCVTQTVTVTPKQECEANNHSTTGCTQTTTTVVVNCGNYSAGNSGNLEQKENCTQKTEETCVNNSCNVTPPPKEGCGCKPEEPEKPKSPPKVELETINDFEVNEPGTIAARTTAPAGDSLSVTFFAKGGGEFHNHGIGVLCPGTTNEWCAEYTASSEAGTSIIKVVVQDNTTGLSGEDEQSVRNKPESSF